MSDVQVPENHQYLNHKQMASMNQEIRAIDASIADPTQKGVNKADMHRRRRQIQGMMDKQQAPDLTGEQRDAWAKEAKRLEESFVPGMLSAEVMRKNPPGSVDRNLAWHRRHRFEVARWKNIQRTLRKGDDSPDIANIERLRPHTTPVDPSMHGAQISGKTFIGLNPSEAYKENYDRIFPHTPAETEEPVAAEPEKKGPQKNVMMRCGKVLKDSRGQKMHERNCKQCKNLERAVADEAATSAA